MGDVLAERRFFEAFSKWGGVSGCGLGKKRKEGEEGGEIGCYESEGGFEVGPGESWVGVGVCDVEARAGADGEDYADYADGADTGVGELAVSRSNSVEVRVVRTKFLERRYRSLLVSGVEGVVDLAV